MEEGRPKGEDFPSSVGHGNVRVRERWNADDTDFADLRRIFEPQKENGRLSILLAHGRRPLLLLQTRIRQGREKVERGWNADDTDIADWR